MSAPVIQLDPVIFSIGQMQVRWYGAMYVLGYVIGGYLLKLLTRQGFFKVAAQKTETLVTYLLIGMFLGARLAYVFIYNWDYYKTHMDEILAVWHGGLSFHGAIAGMSLAAYLFARQNKIPLFQVLDSMVLAGSQGLFWGRLGNFINGELYGRLTNSWAGLIFPGGGPYPRHPSQLYEGISEGIILFALLWLLKSRVKSYGLLTSFFLLGYGIFRFCVEFFREPDAQLGYYFNFLTMGQILCLLMVLVALAVGAFAHSKREQLKV